MSELPTMIPHVSGDFIFENKAFSALWITNTTDTKFECQGCHGEFTNCYRFRIDSEEFREIYFCYECGKSALDKHKKRQKLLNKIKGQINDM